MKINGKEIAKHVKENPKIFWKYVMSKTRCKSRIGHSYKDAGKTGKVTSDTEKADILSKQFTVVFIKEPNGNSPPATRRELPRFDHIEITNDKIMKVL